MNIDVSVYVEGFHGDLSETYLVGNVDEEGKVCEHRLVSGFHLSLCLSVLLVAVCPPSFPPSPFPYRRHIWWGVSMRKGRCEGRMFVLCSCSALHISLFFKRPSFPPLLLKRRRVGNVDEEGKVCEHMHLSVWLLGAGFFGSRVFCLPHLALFLPGGRRERGGGGGGGLGGVGGGGGAGGG